MLLQCHWGAISSCPWPRKQHGKLPISIFGARSLAWLPSMTPETLAHLIQCHLHASESVKTVMFSIDFQPLPNLLLKSFLPWEFFICIQVATCKGMCFDIPKTSTIYSDFYIDMFKLPPVTCMFWFRV